MSTFAWDDTEREDGTIERVEGPDKNGWYSATSSNGWTCGVSAEYGVVPKVGDRFVTWGGIGFPIRGQTINGRVLYYRTPEEQNVENQKANEKRQAERVADYEGKRSDFDARVTALPAPFAQRIDAFRAYGGDAWRYEFEPYELMCCEQAVRLADRFMTADAIKAFAALDWKSQEAAFPEIDKGHSGNSWSASLGLARVFVEQPELVFKMHGALCPLVGCDAYGCYSIRHEVAA